MRHVLIATAAATAFAAGLATPALAQTRPDYGYGAGLDSGRQSQTPPSDYDDDRGAPPPERSRGDDRQGGYGASAPADQEGDSGADLMRQLNLRADQRSAFRDYQTAFQSEQNETPLDDPSRLRGMTAPQRLDASAAQMERDRAGFERISSATRRFYASLDPSQRRTFDRLTAPPLDADQNDDGRSYDDDRGATTQRRPPSR